jgi:hypothetical protein
LGIAKLEVEITFDSAGAGTDEDATEGNLMAVRKEKPRTGNAVRTTVQALEWIRIR